ncbi:metalloregulator ArsR/SmtB family transcription factor [Paenibacillus sp. TRM 82003]|nr:metalloregulator ArsR/SmtB family transcription factor [Paenibacillus sp. TRM 82003]
MSEVCDVFCYDEEKVSRVKGHLVTQNTTDMAKIFKALADETRVKVALSLCEADELCVCDVANVIGTTIPNVSHHLRLLKNMGLAKSRKEGKLVFYSLDDEHVRRLILLAAEHSGEHKVRG